MLGADHTIIYAEFWQYETDTDSKIGRLQAPLDDETRRGNQEEKEHNRLFFREVSQGAVVT